MILNWKPVKTIILRFITMSEITYKKIDFTLPINESSFEQYLHEIEINTSPNIQLPKEALNQFLSLLNVYALHYDVFEQKDRPTFLKAVIEEKFSLFDIPKKFSQHLLNHLDAPANQELESLQKASYNLIEPLSNVRALDFVESELMDVCESYRKWEYGYFIVKNFSNYFLENISWNRYTLNEKEIDKIGTHLDNYKKDLSDKEKLLLQLILKAKYTEQKTSMVDYLLIATLFQKQILNLSLKLEQINVILKRIFQEVEGYQKGKGGPKL